MAGCAYYMDPKTYDDLRTAVIDRLKVTYVDRAYPEPMYSAMQGALAELNVQATYFPYEDDWRGYTAFKDDLYEDLFAARTVWMID